LIRPALEPEAASFNLPALRPASNSLFVRHRISITCLLFAWLCANGAVWNVVQVVGWAKMLHDNSRVMSAAKAIQVTFDGSKPCQFCHLSQAAQDTARKQQPSAADLGSSDKILLAFHVAAPLVLNVPDSTWPGAVHATGLVRTNPVPVRPPRV